MRSDRAALLEALVGAGVVGTALRPPRHPLAGVPAFTVGLPVSELPLSTAALSALAAVHRARRGGFRGTEGRVAAGLTAASWAGLGVLAARDRAMAGELDRALPGFARPSGPGVGYGLLSPLVVRRRYVTADGSGSYATDDPAQVYDVWRRPDLPPGAPILLQIPGGAWVTGGRRGQGYALLSHLAARGWVCVSIGYRLAPRHPWPAQIIDVKRALAWIHANAERLGGNPGFVAVTGGSAGGHLAALAALSPGDPRWQPGFEDADTSVHAAVPLYGRYDWIGREGPGQVGFLGFLERYVVQRRIGDEPEVFRDASPLHRVRADAPPFLVVHGTHDSLIPVEAARAFVAAHRAVSRAPVYYAEAGGAQHAFDLLPSVRARTTAVAVETFLDAVRAGVSLPPAPA